MNSSAHHGVHNRPSLHVLHQAACMADNAGLTSERAAASVTPAVCHLCVLMSRLNCCRMYRLVPAASLLQHFASDRSHMRRPDGAWSAQPPPYPCITAADGTRMNLSRFRDMTVDVLQDRVPCQQSSARQGSEASAAAAAASDDKGGKHPCQAAACIGTHPGYDTGGGSGGDRRGSSSSTAAPDVAATDHPEHGQVVAASSFGSEGPRHEQHEPAPSTGPVITGPASTADAHHHSGDRLVMWEDVAAACQRGKFGAVLHEHTLLRCLLGAAGDAS